MTLALEESPEGAALTGSVERALQSPHDAIAAGPGLGTAAEQAGFVRALLDRATVPLLLDADALTVLGADPAILRGSPERPVIITPHPGEMGRLVGVSAAEVQRDRLTVARDFATGHHVYVVLKGHRTLVATPDGTVYVNPTGNPGMATGGSGDVLTGYLAGWLAQGLGVTAACLLGVYLHGAAGDLAAADVGEAAMTAGDIIAELGDAVLELAARQPRSARREP